MELTFKNLSADLTEGTELLSQRLGFVCSDSGIEVEVRREEKSSIFFSDNKAVICYDEPCRFFRALGILNMKLNSGDKEFTVSITPEFNKFGAILDTSRHAAPNVKFIKDYIVDMALMGYNELFLYMEDTYELEGYPYVGYMRGRYSFDELKECDDYGAIFGIELIPAIQTLGHQLQVFKKFLEDEIKESEDLIRVGEEKSYVFIEKLITTATAPFRSKRIHLGMDEAFALGQKTEGVKTGEDRMKILISHINKVCEITKKHGLKPMIWSDMLIRFSSKSFEYYDNEAIPSHELMKELPDEIEIMYEDSRSEMVEEFDNFISRHSAIERPLSIAPAVCKGDEFTFDYDHVVSSAEAAVSSAKKAGIKEMVAVSWGDGGAALSNAFSTYGLFVYAENAYSGEGDVSADKYFSFVTGCNAEIFRQISKLDKPAEKTPEDNLINPTKFILRQDILLGMYDYDIRHVDWKRHYEEIKNTLLSLSQEAGRYKALVEFYTLLCDALCFKATIGIRAKSLYDEKNINGLGKIITCDIPEMRSIFENVLLSFSRIWRIYNRPFACELMDMRFGSIIARIDTLKERLSSYINGEISVIDELEEERLPFNRIDMAITTRNDVTYGTPKSKVVTACTIGRY